MSKYSPKDREGFASKMRLKPTRTESRLYNALTKALEPFTAQLHLQHIIGPYIADFYIPYAQLIIEADGASHAGRKEYDQQREAFMRDRGFRTIRFSNIEIWQDLPGVIKQILDSCGDLKPYIKGNVKITYCPPATRYDMYRQSKYKDKIIWNLK